MGLVWWASGPSPFPRPGRPPVPTPPSTTLNRVVRSKKVFLFGSGTIRYGDCPSGSRSWVRPETGTFEGVFSLQVPSSCPSFSLGSTERTKRGKTTLSPSPTD